MTRAFARKKEERDEGEEKEKGEREREKGKTVSAPYIFGKLFFGRTKLGCGPRPIA